MTPINPNHVVAASPSDTSQGVSDLLRLAFEAMLEADKFFSETDVKCLSLAHAIKRVGDALDPDVVRAALRSEPTASSAGTRSSKVGDWFAAHPQANAVIVLPDGCMVAQATHYGAPPPGSTVFFRKGISIDLRGKAIQQGGNGMHPSAEAAILASRSEPTGEQPIDDADRYRWVREHVTWAGDACNVVKWVFYVPMLEPDISAEALAVPYSVLDQLDAGIDAVLKAGR